MVLARSIAADVGETEAIKRFRLGVSGRRNGFDKRRLVMAGWKVEADGATAPTANLAVPLAKHSNPLLLGLLTPIFPRGYIFGDDRTAHDKSDSSTSVTNQLRARDFCGWTDSPAAGDDPDPDSALFRLGALIGLVLVRPRPERFAPVVAVCSKFSGLEPGQSHCDQRDVASAAAIRSDATRLRDITGDRRLGRQCLGGTGRRENRRIDAIFVLRPPADDDLGRIDAFAGG